MGISHALINTINGVWPAYTQSVLPHQVKFVGRHPSWMFGQVIGQLSDAHTAKPGRPFHLVETRYLRQRRVVHHDYVVVTSGEISCNPKTRTRNAVSINTREAYNDDDNNAGNATGTFCIEIANKQIKKKTVLYIGYFDSIFRKTDSDVNIFSIFNPLTLFVCLLSHDPSH